MTEARWCHDQVEVSREFDASVAALFGSFADLDARRCWAAPPGEQVEFSLDDFSVGGTSVYRCGPSGSLRFDVTSHYLDIVDGVRIVVAERVSGGNQLLSTSLVTWHYEVGETGARIRIVAQISAPDERMVAGAEGGLTGSLRSLESYLTRPDRN
ncbi:SRPBCC domain-containing protein [Nocardioides sp. CER19]|uniref:SRPBCC domain-containing protein n=1 Tax=Nocardioides sp. CER19 TaxID=3038538 RepID=UPI0024492776|nr:SRPBCC domain-containing protein [Nocardioides sp. CER19]MDH2413811.1 SRPBCC domain-containing protein [Nocardioides sp. CER19]